MNENHLSSNDDPVSFWSDETNIEDIHYRFLMGEKVHVPPRPGCNLNPEWGFPQAMTQLEQITRRPTPPTTPMPGSSGANQMSRLHQSIDSSSSRAHPPNIGSLHLTQRTGSYMQNRGNVPYSPRRPMEVASSSVNERVKNIVARKPAFSSVKNANEMAGREKIAAFSALEKKEATESKQCSESAPKNPPVSTVRSLFPPNSASQLMQTPADQGNHGVVFPHGIPTNEELIGKKQEKVEATSLRLKNQRSIDADLIFGTANYEVPLKRIFSSFKEAALFVKNDQRGISGDWNLDNFDAEEEADYKLAVGIEPLVLEE